MVIEHNLDVIKMAIYHRMGLKVGKGGEKLLDLDTEVAKVLRDIHLSFLLKS